MEKIDVRITEEQLPVISMNFEEMEKRLKGMLTQFKGLKVTDETLPLCKEKQKELAGWKRKIDSFRKDKKKELSKPIVEFEEQCKELILRISEVESPIKEQIETFDDEKREEKRKVAVGILKEVARKVGLNDKFYERLEIKKEYMNLTAKEGGVKKDIEAQALVLISEQRREEENESIVRTLVDQKNRNIKTQMNANDFVAKLEKGYSLTDVTESIDEMAQSTFKAENAPKEEPKEEVKEEVQEKSEAIGKPDTRKMEVDYTITGTVEQLQELGRILKSLGLEYETKDRRWA